LRVTAWVRPDQMYATLSALQSTASDPTPDLRRAAATLLVQGEGESVEAFLDRCDREPT